MLYFQHIKTRWQQGMKIVSYFSFSKIVNYLKISVSYILSMFGHKTDFPFMPSFISVEPAGFCNLHCPECPVGRANATTAQPHLTMDVDLFKKIIDEQRKTLFHSILYFQGEPTLAKNLPEIIQYAHRAKIYTSTSTNAQTLSENLAKRLVESGLDKLIISIDGINQESYEAYRIGGSLQRAIDGVENIMQWKKMLKSATPFVEIQCLLLKTNEKEIPDIQKFAKKIGADRLVFKTAQFYDFENGNPLMPTHEKFSRYRRTKSGKYQIKSKLRNRCWRLWSGAVISATGDVIPCCFDKNGTFSYGNIYENSFYEIYNNQKINIFRKNILENRQQFEMCRNCSE